MPSLFSDANTASSMALSSKEICVIVNIQTILNTNQLRSQNEVSPYFPFDKVIATVADIPLLEVAFRTNWVPPCQKELLLF